MFSSRLWLSNKKRRLKSKVWLRKWRKSPPMQTSRRWSKMPNKTKHLTYKSSQTRFLRTNFNCLLKSPRKIDDLAEIFSWRLPSLTNLETSVFRWHRGSTPVTGFTKTIDLTAYTSRRVKKENSKIWPSQKVGQPFNQFLWTSIIWETCHKMTLSTQTLTAKVYQFSQNTANNLTDFKVFSSKHTVTESTNKILKAVSRSSQVLSVCRVGKKWHLKNMSKTFWRCKKAIQGLKARSSKLIVETSRLSNLWVATDVMWIIRIPCHWDKARTQDVSCWLSTRRAARKLLMSRF